MEVASNRLFARFNADGLKPPAEYGPFSGISLSPGSTRTHLGLKSYVDSAHKLATGMPAVVSEVSRRDLGRTSQAWHPWLVRLLLTTFQHRSGVWTDNGPHSISKRT